MIFENWSSENHAKLVPKFFSDDVIEPENIEKYREAIEEALADIEDIYGIDAEFKIVFAEIDVEKFREQFGDDIPDHIFFRGYSLSREAHERPDENLMFLATSDEYEYWKPGLKDLVVHEESHFEFFRKWDDMEHRVWEQILFEGHARFREKEVIEKKDYYWQGRQDSFNRTAEEVKEELDERQSRKENENMMFNFGGDKWPDAKGYVIALEAYRDIVERNNLETDEPLGKSREWVKKEIEKSIDNLYGED